MGFGHRVYRAEDPRARVLRRTARELDAPRYEVAEQLEQAALEELRERRPDRVLETNVEFWAAIVLDFAEVPPHMFTSMFTCARTARLVGAHPRAEAHRAADPPVRDLHRAGGAQGRRRRGLRPRLGLRSCFLRGARSRSRRGPGPLRRGPRRSRLRHEPHPRRGPTDPRCTRRLLRASSARPPRPGPALRQRGVLVGAAASAPPGLVLLPSPGAPGSPAPADPRPGGMPSSAAPTRASTAAEQVLATGRAAVVARPERHHGGRRRRPFASAAFDDGQILAITLLRRAARRLLLGQRRARRPARPRAGRDRHRREVSAAVGLRPPVAGSETSGSTPGCSCGSGVPASRPRSAAQSASIPSPASPPTVSLRRGCGRRLPVEVRAGLPVGRALRCGASCRAP